MKRIILSLFLLPTFLTGCSTSNWYSVDIAKANEIAKNIVLYNKQNIPPHIILNAETYSAVNYSDDYYIKVGKSYAAYNLDQYCFESSRIMFDGQDDTTSIIIRTYQVANNTIIETILQVMYVTYIGGLEYKVDGDVYYAKDNQAAKKEFEQRIVEDFNPYSTLDNLINDPIYHHENGIRTKNPLEDGNCEILAKNNNSLDIKSNWHITESKIGVSSGENDISTMYIENNRCLKSTNRNEVSNNGDTSIYYSSATYDYDTPVRFDN